MAQKTYYQLKYEDKHLEVGDALLIHGVNYTVRRSECTNNYFLNNNEGENCEVFNNFDLTVDEKYSWAKRFNSTGSGSFPEFKDIKDLEKFVIAIFERPEYKIGDYVTILERKHSPSAYPASFVDDMAKLSGKTFLVDGFSTTGADEGRKCHNGDPHWYYLRTPSYGIWTWHSSMFRRATREEILAAQGAKGDIGAKCDSGSASDSITVDTDDASKLTSIREEIKSWEEILGGNTDCTLRLPKNTNKTPHINL